MRHLVIVLLIALAAVGGSGITLADTAAAVQQGGLAYPDPSECQIAPRSDADIRELLATPAAPSPSPAASPSPIPATALPTGQAAGPDALFGINATLRELVACMNAGETARALALVTDSIAAEELHLLFGHEPMLGTPTPVAENERTPFLSIRDPRVVADGQVGAIVSNPANPEEAYFIVFEQRDGRWLIASIAETTAAGVGGP